MQNERQPGGHGELQVLPLLPHLSPQCCHRQREGAGGTGPEGSARGTGRAGVGRAVVQAERRWREASQSGLAMWSALCVGLLPIVAVTGQVALEQHPREMTVQEGDPGTFQCSMKGDSMYSYYMYWYRQGPRGSLKWIYRLGHYYGEGFRDRFKGSEESSKNNFTLEILAATQEDAAIYYCGARTEWTGYRVDWGRGLAQRKLIFGPGTTLTLLPNISRTSNPEIIVMKSKKKEEGGSPGKAACLARNIQTKSISLEMPSKEVVYEQSTSILTSEGLYNAIKVVSVTNDTEVTCTAKLDNSTMTAQPEEEAEGPVAGPSERVCNSTEPSAQDAEGHRVNMLSMAVLGFRVLLAKSIAINTLMSIKLFLL